MYSNVVLGVESYNFEELIENYKLTKGVLLDTELDENDWDGLIKDFKNVVKEKTKKEFPQNVNEQLIGAIVLYFYLGKAIEQKFIENLIKYLLIGEQQLMFNQWYLEIWERLCNWSSFYKKSINWKK